MIATWFTPLPITSVFKVPSFHSPVPLFRRSSADGRVYDSARGFLRSDQLLVRSLRGLGRDHLVLSKVWMAATSSSSKLTPESSSSVYPILMSLTLAMFAWVSAALLLCKVERSGSARG